MHKENMPLPTAPDPDAPKCYEIGECVSLPALAHKTLRNFIVFVVGCCECMVGMEHGQGASLHILPGSMKAVNKLGQVHRLRVDLCDLETIMPDAVSRFGGLAYDVVFDFICEQACSRDEDADCFYLALPFERWVDHAADVQLMEYGVRKQPDLSELNALTEGPAMLIGPLPESLAKVVRSPKMDMVIVPFEDLDMTPPEEEGDPDAHR